MKRSDERPWVWQLLLRARSHSRSLALVLLLWFAGVCFDLLKPWPLKIIVDYVLTGRSLSKGLAWIMVLPGTASPLGLLGWLTASTLVVFLLSWLITVVGTYVQMGTGGRMTYGLAAECFSHVQRLSLRFHNRWPTGDLVKRVSVDCKCIKELVVDVCLPAVTAVATIVTILALTWRIDPTLALLSLAVVPVLGILIRLYAQSLMDSESEQYEIQGEMMAHAEQVLTGLPIIQAFGRETEEGERFAETTQRVGIAYLGTIWTGSQFRFVVGGTTAAGTALLIAIGGRHVLTGQTSLGDLLIFLNYLAYLYAPLETIAYLSMSYASAAAGANRVFELIESDERIREATDAVALPERSSGHGVAIQLENVSFSYNQGSEVLHQVDVAAGPGQTVALVGPTGTGKTTVVSLILRLFDPDQGRVTFDGVDIRRYKLASLRESIAIVLQEAFLLPLSVADNIAYARPEAPRKDVIAAAQAAHAHEFIEKLPLGYDTVIGERGATLSVGQRQRLAIARAFLKDAPVLILDEPTSALDTQAEALVLDATRRLMKGRTTFIIGHRLSTVKHADQIVVLSGGRVLEAGTHQDLLAARGLYHRLYSIQFHDPEVVPAVVGEAIH